MRSFCGDVLVRVSWLFISICSIGHSTHTTEEKKNYENCGGELDVCIRVWFDTPLMSHTSVHNTYTKSKFHDDATFVCERFMEKREKEHISFYLVECTIQRSVGRRLLSAFIPFAFFPHCSGLGYPRYFSYIPTKCHPCIMRLFSITITIATSMIWIVQFSKCCCSTWMYENIEKYL